MFHECKNTFATFQNYKSKGHFILRPSVKQTRDSSNLIGGEQKFVCLAFTLEVNRQGPPKHLHSSTFWEFWPHVWWRKKLVRNYIYGNPNSPQADKLFLSKLIQSLQFIYFYRLLPCLLEGSLFEVLSTLQPYCEAPLKLKKFIW
jgi:hypothetical protein